MMMNEQVYRYFLLTFGLLCLVILILMDFSFISTSQWIGDGKIIEYINSYFTESQKFAREDLLVLLELHSFISPAIGTFVGADKDMLSSFNKLISNTTEIYMYAIIAIEIMKYLLIISKTITPWLFDVLLFIVAIFGVYHSLFNCNGIYMTLCKRLIKVVAILFFILHMVLPYSLYITARFSKNIVEKDRIESRTMLHNLYDQIHYRNDFREKRSQERIVLKLPYKIELMIKYYAKYVVITGLEFIVLPIVLFLISIGILRLVIKEEYI